MIMAISAAILSEPEAEAVFRTQAKCRSDNETGIFEQHTGRNSPQSAERNGGESRAASKWLQGRSQSCCLKNQGGIYSQFYDAPL